MPASLFYMCNQVEENYVGDDLHIIIIYIFFLCIIASMQNCKIKW
jgi:hypothetical protein